MRFRQPLLLGAALLFSQLVLNVWAQPASQTLPKWEYKVIDHCRLVDRLLDIQQLGEEGWELVSAGTEGASDNSSGCKIYYFKRMKRVGAKPPGRPSAIKSAEKCVLTIEKSPVIQGIRLGMSKEELIKLFPRSENIFGYQESGYPQDWPAETIRAISIPYSQIAPNLTIGKNLSVHLFEGKVSRFEISYTFTAPMQLGVSWGWDKDNWKSKISQDFSLPSNAWEKGHEEYYLYDQITCDGFAVKVLDKYSNTIQVMDTTAVARAAQARLDYSQKLRREFKP